MLKFDTFWADEIAEVSESPEFQTATIRILKPIQASAEWDFENKRWADGQAADVVYSGQARVIGVRWGVPNGGESQANAKTVSSVRFQAPQHATLRVHRGCVVDVVAAPRNPAIVGLQLRITSDFQGGSAASRTFEAALDSDGNAL